jgi:hypothetical protein
VAAVELLEHGFDAIERIGENGRSARPSSVMASPRGRRLKSAVPSRSSSVLTCWLTAAWVTFNSSAARVKLRCRAEDSKARSAFNGRYGLMAEA